jgi:hypothetical protein
MRLCIAFVSGACHMGQSAQIQFESGSLCSLIDRLGGIDAAVALVKEKCDIAAGDEVTLLEESMDTPSLQAILSGAGVTRSEVVRLVLTDPSFIFATLAFTVLPLMLQVRCLRCACLALC